MIRKSLLFTLFLATPAVAQDIALGLPLDCTLAQDCHIQNYVDRDPGPQFSDFACGSLGYDGHKGTDFTLPSLAAMQAGVDVLAASAGVVVATRNSMPDITLGSPGAPDITDKECGNGVLLRHPDGWETQYCHMKQGSIRVKAGQTVMQGDPLGQVGLSGKTQFPHVHLSVRKDGHEVDPFDADQTLTCNDPAPHSLWQSDIAYVDSGLIAVGFMDGLPDYADIKAGTAAKNSLPANAAALVFWGYAFGTNKGDVIELLITGPKGEVIRHKETFEKHQAQLFRAAGKRTPSTGWPNGRYHGTATLLRDGVILAKRTIAIEVE